MPFFLPSGWRSPIAIQPTRPSVRCETVTFLRSSLSVHESLPTLYGTKYDACHDRPL